MHPLLKYAIQKSGMQAKLQELMKDENGDGVPDVIKDKHVAEEYLRLKKEHSGVTATLRAFAEDKEMNTKNMYISPTQQTQIADILRIVILVITLIVGGIVLFSL